MTDAACVAAEEPVDDAAEAHDGAAEYEGEAHDDESEADGRVDTSHLDGVEDGCGCAEVWEHLSEQRGE